MLDVARRAGVSRATASLVLRGEGRVSEETRRRVFGVMDELGYVYNRGAASLRSRTSNVIGVLVTTVTNPFFAEVIVGLEESLSDLGYVTLLANTLNDAERQGRLVTFLQENNVAAVALVPAVATADDALDALTESVPVLHLTRSVGDPALSIGTDDVRGGFLAGEHLAGHGARRVVYVGGRVDALARRDRMRGVRDALVGGDLAGVPSSTSGAGGLEAGRRALAEYPDLDAVVCHSDDVAIGVLAALHEAGRARDIRVISFDGIEASALVDPPLTTVTCGPRDLGREAALLLSGALADGAGAMTAARRLEPRLVVRASCGCPWPRG